MNAPCGDVSSPSLPVKSSTGGGLDNPPGHVSASVCASHAAASVPPAPIAPCFNTIGKSNGFTLSVGVAPFQFVCPRGLDNTFITSFSVLVVEAIFTESYGVYVGFVAWSCSSTSAPL